MFNKKKLCVRQICANIPIKCFDFATSITVLVLTKIFFMYLSNYRFSASKIHELDYKFETIL